jgi:hypothetical protein
MTELEPRKIRNVWLVPIYEDDGTFNWWEAIKCRQWTCDAPMSKECECWIEVSEPDAIFDTLAQARKWVSAQWKNDASLRWLSGLIK